jgi:menaquinone-9 beta-reductase
VESDAIEMRAGHAVVSGLGLLPGGSANVTVVVPSSQASSIARGAGEYLERRIADSFPDLGRKLAGAVREDIVRTVGCFGHRCSRVSAAGAILVGDAATFIDPFTGEGIYFALEGARLAAAVADVSLRENDLSAKSLSAYDEGRAELSHRYLLCDVVQGVVRAPRIYARVIRRLSTRGDLTEDLMAVLGDVRPAASALNPRFLWRMFAPWQA